MYIKNQIMAFQYLGSKYSVLPWLLQQLPESKIFVDVCGGGATVILNRKPSKINVYNDINTEVVNFFEVLRDQPQELITKLELTLHSRTEYFNACEQKDASSKNSGATLIELSHITDVFPIEKINDQLADRAELQNIKNGRL